MEILTGLDGLRRLPEGAVASIGNFDGVHRGHRAILSRARELRAAEAGRKLAVVTFEPHPLTVLRPEMTPPRLTGMRAKRELLEGEGADYLVELPPDKQVLDLTAEQFWRLLRDEVRPSWLVEGRSFNFGKNRGGTIEKLEAWSRESAVGLEVVDAEEVALTDLTLVAASSSLVRWLVAHGRVRDAAVCLGRAYRLDGEVVKGHQRGRTIGVPTANLACGEQLVPLDGVYAGRCAIDGVVHPAALSVGTMPTFGRNDRQVEAHLVGFSGDLYGRTIGVEVVDWVRDQRKYKSLDALLKQMKIDIEYCVERAGLDPAAGAGRGK